MEGKAPMDGGEEQSLWKKKREGMSYAGYNQCRYAQQGGCPGFTTPVPLLNEALSNSGVDGTREDTLWGSSGKCCCLEVHAVGLRVQYGGLAAKFEQFYLSIIRRSQFPWRAALLLSSAIREHSLEMQRPL